jgi:hypothetical protein
MALPERVRVKISSEAAGAISLSPVVVQEIPVRELIEHMLGVAGKDEARICELLKRGTLVSGASRFRWTGWAAAAESVREVLATFPDADPARTFAAERCVRAVLRGARGVTEVPREAAAQKGLLRRGSFWDVVMDVVMEVAAGAGLGYAGYSYRDRADRFTAALTPVHAERLREGSEAAKFSTLREAVRLGAFTAIEVYVER